MVQIKWEMGRFHNVIDLPEEYEVRDLTTGVYRPSKSEYDVGKYDENRPMVYNTDLFQGTRTLHVGIDIGAPVHTPCMSFEKGEIAYFGYNPSEGDYGHVVVTKHELQVPPWALYGHLSSRSILGGKACRSIVEIVGWIGKTETEMGAPLAFSIVAVRPHDPRHAGCCGPKRQV